MSGFEKNVLIIDVKMKKPVVERESIRKLNF
jgi:hypothetical protein